MQTVSVIIPTYNAGVLVAEAVASALNQTWPAVETIVVNDGSTDDTRDHLAQFGSKIVVLKQENQGRSAARNNGIRRAQGDFIAFLDADDFWYPTKLEAQMKALQSAGNAHWAYCQTRLVYEDGSPLRSAFWSDLFGSGSPGSSTALDGFLAGRIVAHTSTMVIHRKIFDETGFFDESLPVAEDTNLWIRLAQRVQSIIYLPEVLATRRVNTAETFGERLVTYRYAEFTPRAILGALEAQEMQGGEAAAARSAIVKAYLTSTFIELLAERRTEASLYWQEVLARAAPENVEGLAVRSLAGFSLAAARFHDSGPLEAERNFASLARSLTSLGWVSSGLLREAKGHLYAAISQMFCDKEAYSNGAAYARRALISNPKLARNLGLDKRALGFGRQVSTGE